MMSQKFEISGEALLAAATAIGGGLVLMWGQVNANTSDINSLDRHLVHMREDVVYIRERVDEIAEQDGP